MQWAETHQRCIPLQSCCARGLTHYTGSNATDPERLWRLHRGA